MSNTNKRPSKKKLLKKSYTDGHFLEKANEAIELNNGGQRRNSTFTSETKVICLNCMKYTSDHCTARCPTIKCKLCGKFGHVKRDCPKVKHKIKDYKKEQHEKDDDLMVYWGGHCDVCKQGVEKLKAQRNNNAAQA